MAFWRTADGDAEFGWREPAVVDLYAMSFDPVSDRRNYTTVKDPERLRQQNEESHASKHNGYVAEL